MSALGVLIFGAAAVLCGGLIVVELVQFTALIGGELIRLFRRR